MKNGLVLCLLVLLPTLPSAGDSKDQPVKQEFDPIDHYVEKRIEGWKVLVNQVLLTTEHRELSEQTLKLLDDHLYRITRVVPEPALGKLQRIPIWIEWAHGLVDPIKARISRVLYLFKPQRAGRTLRLLKRIRRRMRAQPAV